MNAPTPEEGRMGIARANSPEKVRAIGKARKSAADMLTLYRYGKVTPNELATQMARVWLEAQTETE